MSAESRLPLLLTPAEAARELHISRSTLYARLLNGELHALKVGGATRIARREIEAWIDRHLESEVTV